MKHNKDISLKKIEIEIKSNIKKVGGEENNQLIKKIISNLNHFHNIKKLNIEQIFSQPEYKTNFSHDINKSANIQHTYTEVLQEIIEKNLYTSSANIVGISRDYSFFKELESIYFNKKCYTNLSKNIIELFNFREILQNSHFSSFREEFIQYYGLTQKNIKIYFDIALELYFLKKFNQYFTDLFLENKNIASSKLNFKTSPLIAWYLSLCDNEKKLSEIIYSIELEFIIRCIKNLRREYDLNTVIYEYRLFFGLFGGVATGIFSCILLLYSGIMLPILVNLAISFFLAIIGLKICLNVFENNNLKFSKTQQQRDSINSRIELLSKRHNQINNIMLNIMEHKASHAVYENNCPALNLLLTTDEIFIGYSVAWLREYLMVENQQYTISPENYEIFIKRARDQVNNFQNLHDQKITTIKSYINNTKAFLKNKKNQNFIKTHNLICKIKEQLLNIAAFIVPNTNSKVNIGELEFFYISAIGEGGLGGNICDFNNAVLLAPRFNSDSTANCIVKYELLIKTALKLNFKMNQHYDYELLFKGDAEYRAVLGISSITEGVTPQFTLSILEKRLIASCKFLYSLIDYKGYYGLESSFPENNEFILYKMLLLKELSLLSSYNNTSLDVFFKKEISKFIKNWLGINMQVLLFDDSVNQAYFQEFDFDTIIFRDSLRRKFDSNALMYVASAIRMTIASPIHLVNIKHLLNVLYANYKITNNINLILGMGETETFLSPEPNKIFLTNIVASIKDTLDFIKHIEPDQIFKSMGLTYQFIDNIKCDAVKLIDSINILMDYYKNTEGMDSIRNNEYLIDSIKALEEFRDQISRIETPDPEPQLTKSIIIDVSPTKVIKTDNSKVIFRKFLESTQLLKDSLKKQKQRTESIFFCGSDNKSNLQESINACEVLELHILQKLGENTDSSMKSLPNWLSPVYYKGELGKMIPIFLSQLQIKSLTQLFPPMTDNLLLQKI